MNKTSWVILIIVILVAGAGIYWYQQSQDKPQQVGIANPASTNCIELGGTLEIVSEADGAVGYCHLKDGRVCEEWSLMRGGCEVPKQ